MTARVKLVRQHGQTDCAAACLSMILAAHGKRLPLAEIRERVKVDQQGANIYGIIAAAEGYGLQAEALSGTADALCEDVRSGNIRLPVIARIVNRHNFEHFVVVTAISGQKVRIMDPGDGKMTLPYALFRECFLGHIVRFSPTEAFVPERRQRGLWQRFGQMILQQKKLIAAVGLLSMLVTAIGMLGSLLFKVLVDDAASGAASAGMFTRLAILVGGLYILRYLLQLLRGRLIMFMTKRVNLELILGYFNHAIDLPVHFFSLHRTGDMLSRFSDASKIQEAFSNVTVSLFVDVIMCLLSGAVLYRCSPLLLSLTCALLAIYGVVGLLFAPKIEKYNRQTMEQGGALNSHLKETFEGILTIKAFNAEAQFKRRAAELLGRMQDSGIRTAQLSLHKESIIELATSLGTISLLCIGLALVSSGAMTLGTLISFYTLLNYFLSPVRNVIDMQNTLQEAFVAADRLNDIMDATKESRSDAQLPAGPETGSAVQFERVSFRYGNRQLILKDLSLDIRRGERVAIVGESGCGKTTATKLITGFYPPESGHVRIFGGDTRTLCRHALRETMAYVPQDTFMMSDTIRANLLLGNPRAVSDEELLAMLDRCSCGFIRELPFGLNTPLEENGANLSGGQRQRLAIARALLRKPRLLILDEATSHLDAIAEHELLQCIERLDPDLTVVIVAHRLNTVRNCDRIFVLDGGALAESGSHDQLIELDGKYAALWERQRL